MSAKGSRPVMIFAGIWFAVAIVAGATNHVTLLKPPWLQVVLAALTLLLILLGFVWGALHDWIATVDLGALIGLHLIRFVAGVGFLVAGRAGTLPPGFAFPAGWGDIGVALIAGLLLLSGGVKNERDRKVNLFWNTLGLADLLFVVATAARFALADAHSMHRMLHLPFSILPTFVVPILLASHFWIFRRLSTPVAEK
jgi:hypothetical protein